MSKRTVFTTVTPLPPSISREVVLDTLHSHVEMIDLNPLVEEHHPIKPPANATPEEYHCTWYSLTDRVQYLPGRMMSGKVSYNVCFHDLPLGLQTHCYAPMGLNIKGKWTIGGSLPGEPVAPVELGLGAPLQGLYLREDVDMKYNIMMTSFVKKTLKKAHESLVGRLVVKAQRVGATTSSSLEDNHQQRLISNTISDCRSSQSSSRSSTLMSSPRGGTNSIYASEERSSSSPVYTHSSATTTPSSTPPVFSPAHPDFRDKEIEADLCSKPLSLRNNRNRSPSSQSWNGSNSSSQNSLKLCTNMNEIQGRSPPTLAALNTHPQGKLGHQRSHSSNPSCMPEIQHERISWKSLKTSSTAYKQQNPCSTTRNPPPCYTPNSNMLTTSPPPPSNDRPQPHHTTTSPPLYTPLPHRPTSSPQTPLSTTSYSQSQPQPQHQHQKTNPKNKSPDTTFQISIPSGVGRTYTSEFNNLPASSAANPNKPDLKLHPALRVDMGMGKGHQRSRSRQEVGGMGMGRVVHYPSQGMGMIHGRVVEAGGLVELEG